MAQSLLTSGYATTRKPSQAGSSTPLALAAAGFVVAGPVGAVAGYIVGSAQTRPATPPKPKPLPETKKAPPPAPTKPAEGYGDYGKTGLKGAASGASLGTAVLPGIGTAIGAGVGFVAGWIYEWAD